MITIFSGWCGEVRDVIYSNSGTVTVVYRVILKGTDGEVYVLFFLFGRFTELSVVSCPMMVQLIAVSKPNHVWKEILMYILFTVPIYLVASCSLVTN